MEFRLNKIDTNLRQRINEETAEGKVHSKQGTLIQSNKYDAKRLAKNGKRKTKEKFNISKYVKGKEKITIEASKVQDVDVKAEKEENISGLSNYKGLFIDSRR